MFALLSSILKYNWINFAGQLLHRVGFFNGSTATQLKLVFFLYSSS